MTLPEPVGSITNGRGQTRTSRVVELTRNRGEITGATIRRDLFGGRRIASPGEVFHSMRRLDGYQELRSPEGQLSLSIAAATDGPRGSWTAAGRAEVAIRAAGAVLSREHQVAESGASITTTVFELNRIAEATVNGRKENFTHAQVIRSASAEGTQYRFVQLLRAPVME